MGVAAIFALAGASWAAFFRLPFIGAFCVEVTVGEGAFTKTDDWRGTTLGGDEGRASTWGVLALVEVSMPSITDCVSEAAQSEGTLSASALGRVVGVVTTSALGRVAGVGTGCMVEGGLLC